jgi:hypothetical protein
MKNHMTLVSILVCFYSILFYYFFKTKKTFALLWNKSMQVNQVFGNLAFFKQIFLNNIKFLFYSIVWNSFYYCFFVEKINTIFILIEFDFYYEQLSQKQKSQQLKNHLYARKKMVILRIKIVGCFGCALIGYLMSFSVLKAPLGMTKSKFAIGL